MSVGRSFLFPTFHCGDCGCDVGFRSRRRTFTERFILPLFLLKPVKNRLSEASGLRPLANPPAPPSRHVA